MHRYSVLKICRFSHSFIICSVFEIPYLINQADSGCHLEQVLAASWCNDQQLVCSDFGHLHGPLLYAV